MSKVFSALRRASHLEKRDAALNGKVADLLLDEQPDTESSRRRWRQNRGEKKRTSDNSKIQGEKGHISEHIVAYHDAKTAAAEQYRKLYIEIARAGHGRELRTLLISSAMPDEGKTTTALNLATIIAACGDERGVLVIETDCRRPSIQNYLGTRPECGLANYLLGDVAYSQIFYTTAIAGLTIVHAGRQVKNPMALLNSEKMGLFFKDVKSESMYSYIIIDSSPILLTAESSILIQYADTVILVVRARKNSRELVSHAIETLGEENILGCVFNGILASDYNFYRHYYNSDYYHSSNDM